MAGARKTRLMCEVEERFNRPIEDLIAEMMCDVGLTETARQMGISPATLGYWMLKLRINVRKVALAPGDTIEVKQVSP
jgi:hypothetical protein